jgi:hypothetical protein
MTPRLLESIVENTHSKFNFEDPTNRLVNRQADSLDWEMGWDFEAEAVFLHENHRRSTLVVVMTYSILGFAQRALQCGGDMYFNDVFLGENSARFGGGSGFGHVICQGISERSPFRDQELLVDAFRELYPNRKTLNLLGPILTKNVVLVEPLFRWVPPEDEGDEDHHFDALPHPLEEMTEDRIRMFGMERWMQPGHGGIGY